VSQIYRNHKATLLLITKQRINSV